MSIPVGEAVRRLRDNDAGLVELGNLADLPHWNYISDAEVRELGHALALNTTLTQLGVAFNQLGDGGGRAM